MVIEGSSAPGEEERAGEGSRGGNGELARVVFGSAFASGREASGGTGPRLSETARRLVATQVALLEAQAHIDRVGARSIARLIVVGADRLVPRGDPRRTFEIEQHVDGRHAELMAFLRTAATVLAAHRVPQEEAFRVAAGYWLWDSHRNGVVPDRSHLLDLLDERYGWGDHDGRWRQAVIDLRVRSRHGAQACLRRAIVDELRARVPARALAALAGVAGDVSSEIVDKGPGAWPTDAGDLRDEACHKTWQGFVEPFAESIPPRWLGDLAGRSVLDRYGRPLEDEVEELRRAMVVQARALDLRDDDLLRAILSMKPRVVGRTEISSDPIPPKAGRVDDIEFMGVDSDDDPTWVAVGEDTDLDDPEGGSASLQTVATPEGDIGEEHLAYVMVEYHVQLRAAVAEVMDDMARGPHKAPRDVVLLEAVAASGDYEDAEALLIDAVFGGKPAEDAKRKVWALMTRAYDRLRAGLTAHGFLMLEDKLAKVSDETYDAIFDCSRLVLPTGVVGPATAAGAPVDRALALEVDGKPLKAVLGCLTGKDEDLEALIVSLKEQRRRVRAEATEAEGDTSPALRALFEPMIFNTTELPAEVSHLSIRPDVLPESVPAAALRAGRVIVLPSNAVFIERKHQEHKYRMIIPRLPEPLSKRHSGRWWHVPDGGVQC